MSSQYGQIPGEMTRYGNVPKGREPRYGPIPAPKKGKVTMNQYQASASWQNVLVYVMLFIMFGVGALLIARSTHKSCSPQCIAPTQRALLAATILSTIFLMGLLVLVGLRPSLFSGPRKFIVIAVFVLLSVFTIVGWSLYGSTQGDATCNCPHRTVRELNAVGIVTMAALAGMIGLLMFTNVIIK